MSPTDDPGRGTITEPLVSATGRAVTIFQVRGGFDPNQLGLLDRALIAVLRARLRRTPDEPAASVMLSDRRLEFVDDSALDPVEAWAHVAPGPES